MIVLPFCEAGQSIVVSNLLRLGSNCTLGLGQVVPVFLPPKETNQYPHVIRASSVTEFLVKNSSFR
jgi:hypothetical protein